MGVSIPNLISTPEPEVPGAGLGRSSWNRYQETALAAIMPRAEVDKQTGTALTRKNSWITGACLGSLARRDGAFGGGVLFSGIAISKSASST